MYLNLSLPLDSDVRLINFQNNPTDEDSRDGLKEILKSNGERDF
ncbi:hypothetical protein ACT7C8_16965 [Bacillus cereus]